MAAVSPNYVYLDWAATAPLCAEAAHAMQPYFQTGAANIACNMNANSLHSPGRAAFEAMQAARKDIAQDLGAKRPSEIIFTSGATEADNAALIGMAHAALAKHSRRNDPDFTPTVITTQIEHDAVLEPAARLARQGFQVIYLKPDKRGIIAPELLRERLTELPQDAAVLVSVQTANSEVGSVQQIEQLARAAHEAGALFHTDATQALGKIAIDLQEWQVDAASFSAHKVGGPKGIGALYLRARTPFEPQLLGGGQEDGRRSTTQNVAGMVGFAAAVRAAVALQPQESQRQRALRDDLYRQLLQLPGVKAVAAPPEGSLDYLPNIVHVTVSGLESETLILRLDQAGFGVSGGSACSSHSLEPSHVLKSLDVPADQAYGALRISFGRDTTAEDLDHFVQAFTDCLA